MTGLATKKATPQCPRCGYDLSGTIASWKTSCPMEGQCSECGLSWAWSDVIGTQKLPRWSFELAPHVNLKVFAATVFRTIRPWSFWSAMRMEHPIRPQRLVWWAVLLLIGSHVLLALACGVAAFMEMRTEIAPQSWGRGRSISLDWPRVISHVARTIAFPYEGTETTYLVTPVGAGIARSFRIGPWVHWLAWTAALPISLIGACYALIPASLRAAKVRRPHLVRIWAYSLVLIPITLIAWAGVGAGVPNPYDLQQGAPWIPVLIGSFFLAGLFWWCATSRYLRLEHALSVAFLLTLIPSLAYFVLIIIVAWIYLLVTH